MKFDLRLRKRFWSGIAGVVVPMCLGVTAAMGAPITYVFSGPASGTLGATVFTGAQTTVTATADTVNITNNGFDPCIPLTGATITIAGVGSATTTGPILMFDNQSGQVWGFENGTCAAGLNDWLDVDDPAAAAYALVTSIGPSTGVNDLRGPVATTAGSLQFTSSPLTFQATLGAAPPPVSAAGIPSVSEWGLALLALMLAGAGSWVFHSARRRR